MRQRPSSLATVLVVALGTTLSGPAIGPAEADSLRDVLHERHGVPKRQLTGAELDCVRERQVIRTCFVGTRELEEAQDEADSLEYEARELEREAERKQREAEQLRREAQAELERPEREAQAQERDARREARDAEQQLEDATDTDRVKDSLRDAFSF